MNSVIFMQYLAESELTRWIKSLDSNVKNRISGVKNIDMISEILDKIWNPSFSKILQQLHEDEKWKMIIIE